MKRLIGSVFLFLAALTLRGQSAGEAVPLTQAAVRLDGGSVATQASYTLHGVCSAIAAVPTYFTLASCPDFPGITGGAAGAPTDAQYVTLATDATLSAESVLVGGLGLGLTGSTLAFDLSEFTTDATATGSADFLVYRDTGEGADNKILVDDLLGVRTLTAGVGISGGGTLGADRTFTLDLNELTTDATMTGSADFIPYRDVGEGADNKILIDDLLVHPVLGSTVHTDTLTGTVVRGDLMHGNLTPKWARLAVGAANEFLGTDGTDLLWRTFNNLTTEATPVFANDFVPIYSASNTANRKIALSKFAAAAQTLTAGTGISGGGTLAADRTFTLDLSELTTDAAPDPAADFVPFRDASASTDDKVLINDLLGVRTITGGVGIAAMGTLAADKTVTLDLSELTTDATSSVTADFVPYRDAGEGADNKILIKDLPNIELCRNSTPVSTTASNMTESAAVFTCVIPANTVVATRGHVRITITGTILSTAVAGGVTGKLKFNGANVLGDVGTSPAADADARGWQIVYEIMGTGTDAQLITGALHYSVAATAMADGTVGDWASGFASRFGQGTAAVDDAADITVTFTIANAANDAGTTTTYTAMFAELFQ